MERQNVTLSLPKNLIRQAKSAALEGYSGDIHDIQFNPLLSLLAGQL